LGWDPKSFTKQNKGNQRAIKLNVWLWGFSLTLKGNKLFINNPKPQQIYNAQGSTKDIRSLGSLKRHIISPLKESP